MASFLRSNVRRTVRVAPVAAATPLWRRAGRRLDSVELFLLARLSRLTQRERFLVAALAVIVLATLVVLPFLAASSARERLALMEAGRAEAEQAATRLQRERIGAFEATQLADLRALSLQAPTLSMARIRIEQSIAAAAEAASLPLTSLTVSAALEENASTPLLRATFSSAYDPAAFYQMLDILTEGSEAVFPDLIEVTGDARPEAAPRREGDVIVETPAFAGPLSGQARVELLFPVIIATADAADPPEATPR